MSESVATPRLELRHITKRYPSVVANDDVSLLVAPGEIHAVLGENGAGKSTLMKIIYGAVKPDAGEMFFDGVSFLAKNPRDARAHGISMVFQHFSLFETLSVAENIWLGLDKSMSLDQVRASIASTAEKIRLAARSRSPGAHALGRRTTARGNRAFVAHASEAFDSR
jgi:general nucleoside transport system ATP-binding protein